MDKKLFIIAIAVGSAVLTTLLSVFLRQNKPNPKIKRLLWMSFTAGVVVLVILYMIRLSP